MPESLPLSLVGLCIVSTFIAPARAQPSISVSPSVLQRSGDIVNVSWSGLSDPSPKDWIGLWSADNATYFSWIYTGVDVKASRMHPAPRGKPVPGNELRDPASTRDLSSLWHDFVVDPTVLETGSGTIAFKLYNMRLEGGFRFWLYNSSATNHNDPPVAISPPVTFKLGDAEPTQPHISLTKVPGQLRIMWVSGNFDQPVVRFGPSASALLHAAKGSTRTYSKDDVCELYTLGLEDWISPGWIHDVVIDTYASGLQPGADLYYSYGSGSDFSAPVQTRTPSIPGQSPDASFKFVMYADMGVEKEFCADCNLHVVQGYGPGAVSVVDRVVSSELDSPDPPAFIMHSGDLGYARSSAFVWDIFFHTINPLASRVPYHVSIGNHEYDHLQGGAGKDPSGSFSGDSGYHPSWGNMGDDSDGECGVPTYHRFHMPDTGNSLFWYSFAQYNVYVIVLSMEHSLESGSPQREWFETTLAAVDRSAYPWLIVTGHRPVYCSQDSPSDYKVTLALQAIVGDLLQQYSVTMFLAGHYHSYERTCPVYNGTCVGDSTNPGATIHATVGTAGIAQGSSPWLQKPWSVWRSNTVYGYARVNVLGSKQLHWQLIDATNGTVLDEVVIGSNTTFSPRPLLRE